MRVFQRYAKKTIFCIPWVRIEVFRFQISVQVFMPVPRCSAPSSGMLDASIDHLKSGEEMNKFDSVGTTKKRQSGVLPRLSAEAL
jgi:hypothetical protein